MNQAPTQVHVPPGEWLVTREDCLLTTLLGSCVAITAWHPGKRAGGLCHYLLPRIPANSRQFAPDARYGLIALQLLQGALQAIAPLQEFQFGCFGGSVMFHGNEKIGETNIELAREWLRGHRIHPLHTDVGGLLGRKITLNTLTGELIVKRLDPLIPGSIP